MDAPVCDFDAVVVGGGPAGLSAALVLGRCRRTVLLCDAGRPRNASSEAVHGFFTRDGTPPAELLAIGRAQLAPYAVQIRDEEVVDASVAAGGFEVVLANGATFTGRKLVLATGIVDLLPEVEGLRQYYGKGVHHCPYCDAWEYADGPLVAYGHDRASLALAGGLITWSDQVSLCTDGKPLTPDEREELQCLGVRVLETPIARLVGDDRLRAVMFADGSAINASALFFTSRPSLNSSLAQRLGCTLTRRGLVRTARLERTRIPGLYAIGDVSRDVQFVVVAAAEGARAAVAINKVLQEEEHRRRLAPSVK